MWTRQRGSLTCTGSGERRKQTGRDGPGRVDGLSGVGCTLDTTTDPRVVDN